jgi:hypothetical protein
MTPIATTGFQQLTVTTSAATLASLCSGSVIPAETRHAIFYPEGQNVRWTTDGGNPTATVGMVMEADAQTVFENQRPIFDNMKVISANASSSATLNVSFFK